MSMLSIVGAVLALAPIQQIVVSGHAEDVYRSATASTATKIDLPLKETPASLTVVPAALMKDQAMQSLADVMRMVPGTSVHQGEGNRDQFILRGISTSADLYIDGVRDDAQVFRDLYNLERVEVLKGAGGMVFGRGGAGGVVNRVSKQPLLRHVGEASFSAGSEGSLRGTIDVGNKLATGLAGRVNAMAEKGRGFRDGYRLERAAINPVLTWLPGAGTALTVGAEHLQDERTADRGVPARNGRPLDGDPATFYGNAAQSTARSVVDGAYAVLEHDFGAVQLRNSLRLTHYDKFYQNVYADNANSSSVDAAGNFKLAAYNNANRRSNLFNQTDLSADVHAFGMQHKLLLGLELGHQDSRTQRQTGFFGAAGTQTVVSVPVSDPTAVVTAFRANGSDANNRTIGNVAAVLVQDLVTLNPQWKLLAGLRLDRFETRFDDQRTTTAPVDLQRADKAASPRLGLIWSPTAAVSAYASYAYSFLPSGETLSLAPNTADLAPEKAVNTEVGARWDVAPRLMLSAAVFRLDRRDVRSPDALNPGYFVKTGQQRTEGAELGLQGEVLPGWQVHGGYAYLDGRIVSTTSAGAAGARLQLVPRHMLTVWNRVDLGNMVPGLGAGLGLLHQGTVVTSLDNQVSLPGWTRADGAVYYRWADRGTQLALNIENLFNRRYFATADGNNNISPGAPRNARLTLSTKF
jgi:catecholate siderophore receptor